MPHIITLIKVPPLLLAIALLSRYHSWALTGFVVALQEEHSTPWASQQQMRTAPSSSRLLRSSMHGLRWWQHSVSPENFL